MKLIVGLGNPGKDYDKTRHNAGYLVVDRLIQRHSAGAPVRARFNAAAVEAKLPGGTGGGGPGEPCLLLKPTTYMNRSGQSVADPARFYKLDPPLDIMGIADDVA